MIVNKPINPLPIELLSKLDKGVKRKRKANKSIAGIHGFIHGTIMCWITDNPELRQNNSRWFFSTKWAKWYILLRDIK